jgi:hypothetical protein
MRRLTCLTLALSAVTLAACGDDGATTNNTGTTGDTTAAPVTTGDVPGTSTGAPDPTTGGGTQSGTTTDPPMTTTGSSDTLVTSSTDPITTTEDATTSSTTTTTDATSTSDTGTTDDTTTGVMLGCDLDGPELDAILVHDGKPPPPCGTLEFTGQNVVMSPGPVYALDGCPCNSDCFAPDPWTFTLMVPPDNLPQQMPVCPRIVVERTMSKQGCELVGVTIYELDNDDIPVPWYIAGSLLGPPAAAPDLELEQTTVETCADCPGCCNDGERYDLEFTFFGDMLTLAEGEEGVLDHPDPAFHHNVTNYQSHSTGICDASPAIDWIVSLELD